MIWKPLTFADLGNINRVTIAVRKRDKKNLSVFVTIGYKLLSAEVFLRKHLSAHIGEGEDHGWMSISLNPEGEFLGQSHNSKRRNVSCVVRLPLFEPLTKPIPVTIVPHRMMDEGKTLLLNLNDLFASLSPSPETPSTSPSSTEPSPPPPSISTGEFKTTTEATPTTLPTPTPQPEPASSPSLKVEAPAIKDPTPTPTPAAPETPSPSSTSKPVPPPTPGQDQVPPPWRGKPAEPPTQHPTRKFGENSLCLIGSYLFWNMRDRVAVKSDTKPLVVALLKGPLSREAARDLAGKKADIDALVGNIRSTILSLPEVTVRTLDGSNGWDLVT